MFSRAAVSIALASLTSVASAHASAFDTTPIEKATGMKGTYNAAENVYKVTKPRPNLAAIDGWKIPPFLGVSSYAAFTPMGNNQVMVMGDNVLNEDEVGPTMSAALENGLEVTALHNHFFFDQPKLYFMHIGGMGDASQLAAAVKKVLDAPERVRSAQAAPAAKFPASPAPAESHITGGPLETILGKKGESNNGMFKVSYGRPVKMHGVTMGDAMGVNTWAGFAGTDDSAVVDGDFAVLENELQPVLKSLRSAGINILAIHQHMTNEEPRTLFLHYWGQGKAQDLAKAVRAAVSLTSTKISP
ncbi:DUF1259 domain-containing protein [Noviherbaspirillum soli]|uniref:DUF1259 domain-containing protein n=1 Tax=Noviherbaspirillum soli TaxID=1064518 RepID=UPI00188D513E|nr:DUF1259 domain-containing protein [Noviherbaspirillum soli]